MPLIIKQILRNENSVPLDAESTTKEWLLPFLGKGMSSTADVSSQISSPSAAPLESVFIKMSLESSSSSSFDSSSLESMKDSPSSTSPLQRGFQTPPRSPEATSPKNIRPRLQSGEMAILATNSPEILELLSGHSLPPLNICPPLPALDAREQELRSPNPDKESPSEAVPRQRRKDKAAAGSNSPPRYNLRRRRNVTTAPKVTLPTGFTPSPSWIRYLAPPYGMKPQTPPRVIYTTKSLDPQRHHERFDLSPGSPSLHRRLSCDMLPTPEQVWGNAPVHRTQSDHDQQSP